MSMNRSALARSVPSFGRRAASYAAGQEGGASSRFVDDLRLFVLTFAGAFLFMSVYLA